VSRYLERLGESDEQSLASGLRPQESRERRRTGMALPVPDHVSRMIVEQHDAFVALTRKIERRGPEEEAVVVLVAGCGPEVGTSSVALALAWVASEEHSALLVDVDMENAGLSRLAARRDASPRNRNGLAISPGQRLAFLPLKPTFLEKDSSLIVRSYCDGISRQRKERDIIVLDGGATFGAGSRWAPAADIAILVCDARKSAPSAWGKAWDRLEEASASVLGVVETNTTFPVYAA
jgi:Mrp family chromosome partitioning ATPase